MTSPCGNMKTPTREIATRIITMVQFPPGTSPRKKIPTQNKSRLDNSHPDNSHPGKLPPGKFQPGQLLPRKTATRKIPTRTTHTQENSHPENCHPDNSHTEDFHLEKFSSGQLPPRIINHPANLIKWVQQLLILINSFVPNAPFFFRLKTSENRKVFRCFQGIEKGCIGKEWVQIFN